MRLMRISSLNISSHGTVDHSLSTLSSTRHSSSPAIIGLRAGTPSVAGGTILYPSLVDLADGMFRNAAGRKTRNNILSPFIPRSSLFPPPTHSHESHDSHQLGIIDALVVCLYLCTVLVFVLCTFLVLCPVHPPLPYTVREGPGANGDTPFAVCHLLPSSGWVWRQKASSSRRIFGRRHRISAVAHRSSLGTGYWYSVI